MRCYLCGAPRDAAGVAVVAAWLCARCAPRSARTPRAWPSSRAGGEHPPPDREDRRGEAAAAGGG
jgi:hypothetical protein